VRVGAAERQTVRPPKGMQVETRELTEAELRAAIAAYTVRPPSGGSAFAYYGMYAILFRLCAISGG
jgi:hypothetical protein